MSRSSRSILRRVGAVALALPLLAGPAIGATASDGRISGPSSRGGLGQVEANSPIDWICERFPNLPPCTRGHVRG